MADITRLEQALRNAHNAGDANAAKVFAAEIRKIRGESEQFAAQAATLDPIDLSIARSKNDAFGAYLRGEAKRSVTGESPEARDQRLYGRPMQGPSKAQSALVGWADGASAGFADEMGAGLDAALTDRTYDQSLQNMREMQRQSEAENPKTYVGGQIGGGITQGAVLAGGGLSLGANAAGRGATLGRVAAGSAADGAVLGAAQGMGSGEDAKARIRNAIYGGAAGLGIGAAAPYAVAGASKALSPIVSPIAARMFPERYAQDALGTALRRSGMSTDDVAAALQSAQNDGQGVFTVADALGHPGQRMLSTVVRNPHDGRREVVERLLSRQAGQGRRLSTALTEGFGAPQTAKQTEAAMEALRKADADVNFGAARAAAGPVDPSSAIAKADEFINPGASSVFSNSTDIADNSVEAAVRRAKSYLTDGNSVLNNFDAAHRAKIEIQNMIDTGSKSVQAQLIPIKNELDAALEAASQPYAAARDTFRQQSKVLEATNKGRQAAMSGRTEDTIPAFNALSDAEKAGFRPGYVDPYIADIQKAAGPMTNKARGLISDATAAEFPAFAVPGKADQLMQRIGREQTMFETANTALGNSKTADNLADAADMAQFDPGVFTAFATGGWKSALGHVVQKSLEGSKGMSPRVIEKVGKSLMETNPQAAKAILDGGLAKLSKSDRTRALIANALISSGVTIPGRLPPP